MLALCALGAAPCVAQPPAVGTLRLRAGQEWTYRTRALDSGSTLVVLKVDRAEASAVAARLLADHQVTDLTIEDPPIDDVIDRVFTDTVAP